MTPAAWCFLATNSLNVVYQVHHVKLSVNDYSINIIIYFLNISLLIISFKYSLDIGCVQPSVINKN